MGLAGVYRRRAACIANSPSMVLRGGTSMPSRKLFAGLQNGCPEPADGLSASTSGCLQSLGRFSSSPFSPHCKTSIAIRSRSMLNDMSHRAFSKILPPGAQPSIFQEQPCGSCAQRDCCTDGTWSRIFSFQAQLQADYRWPISTHRVRKTVAILDLSFGELRTKSAPAARLGGCREKTLPFRNTASWSPRKVILYCQCCDM
jgi:hypothetical protein